MKTRGFYLMAMIPMLACCFSLFAQDSEPNKIVPVSPEAAALAKMVNYPINHNTGIPDIRIPFYEINVGGLTLPIELVYHAGGFRINEQATRAGLGWSLSSDLQITRTINGKDDLKANGYIYNNLVKAYSGCTGCEYPISASETYALASGGKDASPDKFNYKLPNKSGSFYFLKNSSGNEYSIVPVPFDNIKIVYNDGQFVITDTDGTTYYYGETGGVELNDWLEKGIEVSGPSDNYSKSAWKCKRVVSAQGIEEITFTYTPKGAVTYKSYNDYVEYYSNDDPCALTEYYTSDMAPLNTLTTYNNYPTFYHISSPRYQVSIGGGKSYLHVPYLGGNDILVDKEYEVGPVPANTNTINGLSVSEITFRGGKIQFTGADKLSTIRVLDANNTELKTLSFFHSYTNALYVNEAKTYNGSNFQGTMYLDSLHIKNGSTAYERYELAYESKFCYGNHLKGQDAWGYPNVSTKEMANNSALLSLPTINMVQPRFYRSLSGGCTDFASDVPISISGNDWAEAPDEPSMKKGILKRIIYPTGGYVDFDFESNQYMEEFTGQYHHTLLPQLGGGLRIRSINTFDVDGQLEGQKYYRYGKLEEGTGLLINRPDRTLESGKFHYGALSYEQKIAYLKVQANPAGCYDRSCLSVYTVENKTTYQPASTLDYTYGNGAPIYYEKVTEYNQDLGQQTGRIVYEYYPPEKFFFMNLPFYGYNRVPDTNIPILKTDGLMGVQKSVKQYQYLPGDRYGLVSKKEFTYLRYLKPEQIRVAYAFLRVSYPIIGGGSFQGNVYDTGSNFASSPYDLGEDFIRGEYGIPVVRLVPDVVTETLYEGADSLKTLTDYDYDYFPYLNPSKITTTSSQGEVLAKERLYAYNFSGTAVYDTMVNRNMLDAVIEEIETNVSLGNKEIARRRTDYHKFLVGWGVVAPATVRSSFKGEPMRTVMSYQEYDQFGNVLQLKNKEDIVVSYLWGYDHLYPVAELTGQSYATIPASYKTNVQITNPTDDASLRTLLAGLHTANVMANTYTFKRLVGVSSHTQPNKKRIHYSYDPIGRLIARKDHNEHIQEQYSYRMRNSTSSPAAYLSYTNVPVMRTQNYECSPGNWQVFNAIVPGGTHILNDRYLPNKYARQDAESGLYGTPPPCPSINNTAMLKLRFNIPIQVAFPSVMAVDFVQEGSVIATYSFQPDNSPPGQHTFRVPEGIYQVSIRISADVNYKNGGGVYFSVLDSSDPSDPYENFQNGDVVEIVSGGDYEIYIGTISYN